MKPKRTNKRNQATGWNREAKEYNKLVDKQGHYFHEKLILPRLVSLMALKKGQKLLDLGCGQGVLARAIAKDVLYVGVDSAKDLIKFAEKQNKNPNHKFVVASATKPLSILNDTDFDAAAFVLSLQNMELPFAALKNAAKFLKKAGKLYLVLNHPIFRIPRQTGWGQTPNKIQYRWINRYMSHLSIPISMHPGHRNSPTTLSFHYPLSGLIHFLREAGFVILDIEEWTSEKESKGPKAKAENMARAEIPLFMCIICEKK